VRWIAGSELATVRELGFDTPWKLPWSKVASERTIKCLLPSSPTISPPVRWSKSWQVRWLA
jgi:hypothetical protein